MYVKYLKEHGRAASLIFSVEDPIEVPLTFVRTDNSERENDEQ